MDNTNLSLDKPILQKISKIWCFM